ncbi:MAG: bifunctional hydroxymethylpyrimidine kinase/phosphomethylpyrimidine kinase [Bacteroidales bacterium]
MKAYKKVLSIAGSDSGGGAGIQADLKTISALGCYGTTAITAITAQNTRGVQGIFPVTPEMVEKQIRAVLEDVGTDAVKIGMLHSAKIIRTVSVVLREFGVRKIVLDPVMVAASGDRLIEDNTLDAMRQYLFPLADLVTPNIPEAGILLEEEIATKEEMTGAAARLLKLGSRAVLLKGGHMTGEILYDVLARNAGTGKISIFENRKINTGNVHGTGCTLSSAIASFLARGEEMEAAVEKAIGYMQQAIGRGKDYRTGRGAGPVNHFFDPEKLK